MNKSLIDSVSKILLLLLVTAIFSFAYYLIFFNIYVSSDNIYEEVLSRALIARGIGALKNLTFTFAPAYFPDFLGHLLIKIIFNPKHIVITIYFATLFQILMLAVSMYLILNEVKINTINAILYSLTICVILLTITTYYPHAWLWYYSANDNLCATILSFFSVALILRLLKEYKLITFFCLFIISTIAIASNILFVLTFLVPGIATLVLIAFRSYFRQDNKVLKISLFTILALCASYLFAIYIDTGVNIHSVTNVKLKATLNFKDSVQSFIALVLNIIGHSDTLFISITYVAISLMSTLYALHFIKSKLYNNKHNVDTQAFFWIFFIFIMFTNFIGPILGGFIYYYPHNTSISLRYFTTIAILPIMALTVSMHHGAYFKDILKFTLFLSFSILLVINLHIYKKEKRTVTQVLQEEPSSAGTLLAQCIDDYTKEYNLKLGVSSYWSSYPVGLFSKNKVWIDPVTNYLYPIYVIDDHTFSTNISQYNFILVDNDTSFEFTEEKILQNKILPDKILSCPLTNAKIFVFNESAQKLNALLNKNITDFLSIRNATLSAKFAKVMILGSIFILLLLIVLARNFISKSINNKMK